MEEESSKAEDITGALKKEVELGMFTLEVW